MYCIKHLFASILMTTVSSSTPSLDLCAIDCRDCCASDDSAVAISVDYVVDTCAMSRWRHAACAPLPYHESISIPKPDDAVLYDVYNEGAALTVV